MSIHRQVLLINFFHSRFLLFLLLCRIIISCLHNSRLFAFLPCGIYSGLLLHQGDTKNLIYLKTLDKNFSSLVLCSKLGERFGSGIDKAIGSGCDNGPLIVTCTATRVWTDESLQTCRNILTQHFLIHSPLSEQIMGSQKLIHSNEKIVVNQVHNISWVIPKDPCSSKALPRYLVTVLCLFQINTMNI